MNITVSAADVTWTATTKALLAEEPHLATAGGARDKKYGLERGAGEGRKFYECFESFTSLGNV